MNKWIICYICNIDYTKIKYIVNSTDVLIPIYKDFKILRNKKVEKEILLYPNYIFLRNMEIFNRIKNSFSNIYLLVHSCKTIINNKEVEVVVPYTISEEMILKHIEESINILNRLRNNIKSDKAVVLDGPFIGREGKVLEVCDNKVKLALKLFGRMIQANFRIEDINFL